jgi:hypothetical protein
MKEYLQPLLLCAAALTVEVGCSSLQYRAQTPLPNGYHSPPQLRVSYEPRTKKVEILSDPAGARIEVNDNYVGDAPITVEIPEKAANYKLRELSFLEPVNKA